MKAMKCTRCGNETEGTYNEGGILTSVCDICDYRERRERDEERERIRAKYEVMGDEERDLYDLLYGDFHEECGDR